MRVIHTADVHLDACFASEGISPGAARALRAKIRDVFDEILTRAKNWPADVVLIAGDLFELAYVTRNTVAFLKQALERVSPIPVFIAPGDADPFTPDSPYAYESWPKNVHVFSSPHWETRDVPLLSLKVHGFGFDAPIISENPFPLLRFPDDGMSHIVVAHGCETTHVPPGETLVAPFRAQNIATRNLLYAALGHRHTCMQIPADYETSVCYSGSPHALGFAETGDRYYIEIETDAGAGVIRPARRLDALFETHELDCSTLSPSRISELLRAICSPCDSATRYVRVFLQGEAPHDLDVILGDCLATCGNVLTHLEVIDTTTSLDPAPFKILAQSGRAEFVKRITEELRDAADANYRIMLDRSRALGMAAYDGHAIPLRGLGDLDQACRREALKACV